MQQGQVHTALKSSLVVLFSFGFGILTGILGVGPWSIGLMALAVLFGLGLVKARGLLTLLMLSSALPALIIYAERGDVHWSAAAAAAVGSLIGALIGAAMLKGKAVRPTRWIVNLLLIAAALGIVIAARHPLNILVSNPPIGATFWVGAGAGFIGSLAAVATGSILVPAIVLLLHVSQRSAQSIALAAIIPASIPLVLAHYSSGGVDRSGLGQHIIAAALGGIIGAGLAGVVSPYVLAIIFGCFLAGNAAVGLSRSSV